MNAAERARQHLRIAEGLIATGRGADAADQLHAAMDAAAEGLAQDPANADCLRLGSVALWHLGRMPEAARLATRTAPPVVIARSVVIPVLDRPSETRFSIDGLLEDLAGFSGEVIVVFNDQTVFEALKTHSRIDKWAALSANAGVARAWNIGINLAEGEVIFILNADLRLDLSVLAALEAGFTALPDAAILGVEGETIDPDSFVRIAKHEIGTPIQKVDKISGYCFAIHAQRWHDAGITFDPRLSPYFYEELDAMLKARAAGLSVYVVPIDAKWLAHGEGISRRDKPIHFFGHLVDRARVLAENAARIQARWKKFTHHR